MKRPGRLPARGAVASAFLRMENPRTAPSIPPSQQARCRHGISPVYHRCISHVDGINMGDTPVIYRSNTVVIPWRHPGDTGPGVVSSASSASRGPPQPDALGTPPGGALADSRTLSPWALAPEHESPRSQQPRMSTSFAPKGLHELALDLGALPPESLDAPGRSDMMPPCRWDVVESISKGSGDYGRGW
jgi:hypothetical protein